MTPSRLPFRRQRRVGMILAAIFGIAFAVSISAQAAVVPYLRTPAPGKASFGNGRNGVRSFFVHGDTLYVGGSFTVSQGGVTRRNLAAFDLEGNLKPAFAPEPNGTVWAMATDGETLFVGGEFTRLGIKSRLAAIDPVTGEVRRPFTAHVAGRLREESPCGVRGLAVITDTSVTPPVTFLVVGGNFTRANSAFDNRGGLAAVNIVSGDLLTDRFTAGVEGGMVDAILATADTVFVGGGFLTTQKRTTNLVPLTFKGALMSYSFSNGNQPVIDLTIDDTQTRLYAAMGGSDNRVTALNLTGSNRGRVAWRSPKTGGDVQAAHWLNGIVYYGFHDGLFMEPDPYKLSSVDAATGVFNLATDAVGTTCDGADNLANCWLPIMDNTMGQGFLGTWAISHVINPTTGKPTLLVGGEFTQIGGAANSRRFAMFPLPVAEPVPEPETSTP